MVQDHEKCISTLEPHDDILEHKMMHEQIRVENIILTEGKES